MKKLLHPYLKHFLLAIFLLALMLWGAFSMLNSLTQHGVYVQVPNFKNTQIASLDEFIDGFDVEYVITDSIYSDTTARGIVVEQEPKAGSMVKKGRTIYLVVNSISKPQVRMPNLLNLSMRAAKSKLESYGLKLGQIYHRPDEPPPVIDQLYKGRSIKPDELVDRGSVIDLIMGRNIDASPATVPDMLGLNLSEAATLAKDNGLFIEVMSAMRNGTDSAMVLIRKQSPEGGTSLLRLKNQTISLWLYD